MGGNRLRGVERFVKATEAHVPLVHRNSQGSQRFFPSGKSVLIAVSRALVAIRVR